MGTRREPGLLLQARALAGTMCVSPPASGWSLKQDEPGLFKQTVVSDSEGLGWTPRIAFLASSQVVVLLVGVWAPRLGNRSEADSETCSCQLCNRPTSLKAGGWDWAVVVATHRGCVS